MPITKTAIKLILLLLIFVVLILYIFNIPDNRNQLNVSNDNVSSNSIKNFLNNVSNSSTSIYVHPGESIQRKLNNASADDIIVVYPGLYMENLVVNKSLVIMSKPGELTETVIEAADPGSDIFYVTADNVTISGFNVKGANGGINFKGSNGIIYGNKLTSNEYGICLSKTHNNIVENNSASQNGDGIYLSDSSSNILENNEINNSSYGIRLKNSTDNELIFNTAESIKQYSLYLRNSSNNSLYYNRVSPGIGAENGICLENSDYNSLVSNNVSNNWEGIHLSSSSNNELSKNVVLNNYFSIELLDSNNNELLDNTVSSGRYSWEIILSNSRNNILKGNKAHLFVASKVYSGTNSTNNTIEGSVAKKL
jgi:parallel beta-helix repeat protein